MEPSREEEVGDEAEEDRKVKRRHLLIYTLPVPVPGAKYLRGKQRPPKAFAPPVPVGGLKRPGMLKRPAARAAKPHERCIGYDREVCKANRITIALRKFFAMEQKNIFDAAVQRVGRCLGNDIAEEYRKKVEQQERISKRVTGPKVCWEQYLEHRQQVSRELKAAARADYEALVRRDQRVARRKIFFPDKIMARAGEEAEAAEKATVKELCGKVGRLAPNDTDLPLPSGLNRW
eukprot:Skav228569  [mRNA]  locus=scaffold4561:4560:5445:- [translate_table: standard]